MNEIETRQGMPLVALPQSDMEGLRKRSIDFVKMLLPPAPPNLVLYTPRSHTETEGVRYLYAQVLKFHPHIEEVPVFYSKIDFGNWGLSEEDAKEAGEEIKQQMKAHKIKSGELDLLFCDSSTRTFDLEDPADEQLAFALDSVGINPHRVRYALSPIHLEPLPFRALLAPWLPDDTRLIANLLGGYSLMRRDWERIPGNHRMVLEQVPEEVWQDVEILYDIYHGKLDPLCFDDSERERIERYRVIMASLRSLALRATQHQERHILSALKL